MHEGVRAALDLDAADGEDAMDAVLVHGEHRLSRRQLTEVPRLAFGGEEVHVHGAAVDAERARLDVFLFERLGVDEAEAARGGADEEAFAVTEEARGVEADAVAHTAVVDGRDGGGFEERPCCAIAGRRGRRRDRRGRRGFGFGGLGALGVEPAGEPRRDHVDARRHDDPGWRHWRAPAFAKFLIGLDDGLRRGGREDDAVHAGLQGIGEKARLLGRARDGVQRAGPLAAGRDEVLERDDAPLLGVDDDQAVLAGSLLLALGVGDAHEATDLLAVVLEVQAAVYRDGLEAGPLDVRVAAFEEHAFAGDLLEDVQVRQSLVERDVPQVDPQGDAVVRHDCRPRAWPSTGVTRTPRQRPRRPSWGRRSGRRCGRCCSLGHRPSWRP